MMPSSSDSGGSEQELFRPENTFAIILGSTPSSKGLNPGREPFSLRRFLLEHGLPKQRILDLVDHQGTPYDQLDRIETLLRHPDHADILVYCVGQVFEDSRQELCLMLRAEDVEIDHDLESTPEHGQWLRFRQIIEAVGRTGQGRRCVFILDVLRLFSSPELTLPSPDNGFSGLAYFAVLLWPHLDEMSYTTSPTEAPARPLFSILETGIREKGEWLTLDDILDEAKKRSREFGPTKEANAFWRGQDLFKLRAFRNRAWPFAQRGNSLDIAVSLLVDGDFDRDSKIWFSNRLFARARKASRRPKDVSAKPDQNTVEHRLSNTELGDTFLKRFGDRATDLVCQLSVQILAELWPGGDLSERELIVAIGGGDPRLSLVRLMPSDLISDAEVEHASGFLTGRSIEYALAKLKKSGDHDYLNEAIDLLIASKMNLRTPEKVALLVWSARPPLVKFPAPRMIPLCVPTPHIEVDADCGMLSTAGAVVYNQMGVRGITAAFHATGPQGTQVKIGPHNCVVQGSSEVYDTVFIPTPAGLNIPNLAAPKGALVSRPPWASEPVWFWGRSSGEKHTIVTSHDNGLPRGRPGRQLCVQTKPDTEEGDSGAGLVNADGALVGFLFQRTEYGSPIQFSDWIWANSALDALGLSGTPPKKDED